MRHIGKENGELGVGRSFVLFEVIDDAWGCISVFWRSGVRDLGWIGWERGLLMGEASLG